MYVLGIEERKCVNIMGHNSPEWAQAFVAAMCYNCTCSGIYPTNNAESCLYQCEHSEAQLVVVDSFEQLKKFMVNRAKLPNVKAFVIYNQDKLPTEYKDKNCYLW